MRNPFKRDRDREYLAIIGGLKEKTDVLQAALDSERKAFEHWVTEHDRHHPK